MLVHPIPVKPISEVGVRPEPKIFAEFITPYPYDEMIVGDLSGAPVWEHPMGTDESGRDSLSRIMVPARVSVIAALCAGISGLLFGGQQLKRAENCTLPVTPSPLCTFSS